MNEEKKKYKQEECREAKRKPKIMVIMQKIRLACKMGNLGKAMDGRYALENELLYGLRPSAEYTFYEKIRCIRMVNKAIRIIRQRFPGYVDNGVLGEKLLNHTYYRDD